MFGLPIVPTMIIGWALSGMDKVMLRGFCDYSELGMYEVAFKVANIIGIIQACFTSFWVPVAHQWNNENVEKNNFVKAGRIVAFIMTAIFVCVLLVKDVIFMILSDEYSEAVKIAHVHYIRSYGNGHIFQGEDNEPDSCISCFINSEYRPELDADTRMGSGRSIDSDRPRICCIFLGKDSDIKENMV